jgi:N-acetylmuramoyl-L-alanine amidase
MTPWQYAATASAVVLSMVLSSGAAPQARSETPGVSPRKPVVTTTTPQATCDPATFRVVLDVGHTAKVPGATSARGNHEYDFNLSLAKVIERDLLAAGFTRTVLMITSTPPRRGLYERVVRATRLKADLFLAIHHDSVPDSFLQKWEFDGEQHTYCDRFPGHSIFISNSNGARNASLSFARMLGLELKARGLRYTPHYTQAFMGHRRRQLIDAEAGVYRYDRLVVLKDTRMPAVLLEAGSIINRAEEFALMTPKRQSTISAAITEAVKAFCATRSPRSSGQIVRQPLPSHAATRRADPHAKATRQRNPLTPR